jgi:hypothetical protein
MTDQELAVFEDMFYRDLESWFSSDIACCDKCYDDFLQVWPLAYFADDSEFQKAGIDLDTFYEGSFLQDSYSKEAFKNYVQHLTCPRCGAHLEGNIRPYRLPFATDPANERIIEELARTAGATPFLLLKHELAQKVYSLVKSLSDTEKPVALSHGAYRGRVLPEERPAVPGDFGFPPKDCVVEGRYNHASSPVLYLSSDLTTCMHEMRVFPCHIAELRITRPLKVLDLLGERDAVWRQSEVLKMLTYSTLLSSKLESGGWHKPMYVFSRFIADCAKDAGFQAIRYPSTRLTEVNFNLVIIDSAFSLGVDIVVTSIRKYNSLGRGG